MELQCLASISTHPSTHSTSWTPKGGHNLLSYFGPLGILKASHRQIDEGKSMNPQYPFHPHHTEQKLRLHEVVELQIGLWAIGVVFEAGESISLQVSGQYPLFKNYTEEEKRNPRGETGSVGTHIVHFGGKYQSHVVLPVV